MNFLEPDQIAFLEADKPDNPTRKGQDPVGRFETRGIFQIFTSQELPRVFILPPPCTTGVRYAQPILVKGEAWLAGD